MDSPLEKALQNVTDQFVSYLPSLLAGIVLITVGWILGWVARRIVVQVVLVLRFDHLLRRFWWGTAFAKADVRNAVAEFIGDGGFLVVFLVFLNAALEALQLRVLSEVLKQAVLFVPKLLIAAGVLGLGWLLATWIAGSIQRALTKEDVPRATLIARFSKAVMLLFFSAMALTELDIAREIVVIGFSVTLVTLGVLVVVITVTGGKRLVSGILNSFEEE